MLNGIPINEQARETFLSEGYLVVPDVVPLDLCERVIEAILEYTDVRLDDPTTWQWRNVGGHGIVPLHHHQALWDIRQHPGVHNVFATIYGQENLWVSMDRVSYKPPVSTANKKRERAPVHWDCDPWSFHDLGIQGLVYLTDTAVDQGAFSCVPSIYKNLEQYCAEHIEDADRRHPHVSDEDLIPVIASAGSLVLFHRLMPHTSRLNESAQHRFVQYVAMQPPGSEQERLQRVLEWQEKRPPAWAIRQEIEGQAIPEPGSPATLSPLGKKLVGVAHWY